jgi:hypothetical protein
MTPLSTRHEKMQKLIRHYRDVTGIREVDMHKLAEFAESKGWPLPKPSRPIDLLAKEFARAAREEVRRDPVTRRPYRVNHAFTITQGGEQLTLWVAIDEATRPQMLMSSTSRREQTVSDLVQLTLDVEHWNRVNAAKEPIVVQADLTDDVQWRINAPTDEEDAEAV